MTTVFDWSESKHYAKNVTGSFPLPSKSNAIRYNVRNGEILADDHDHAFLAQTE